MQLFSITETLFKDDVSFTSVNIHPDIIVSKQWLNQYKHNYNTFTSYIQATERFILYLAHINKDFKNVNINIIKEYINFLLSPPPNWCTNKKKIRRFNSDSTLNEEWRPFVKGLSKTSINLNLRILNMLFSYLTAIDYLDKNHFTSYKVLYKKEISNNNKIDQDNKFGQIELTSSDIKDLLIYINKPCSNHKYEKLKFEQEQRNWLINLVYYTGLTRSEISTARMSDFYKKKEQWFLTVNKFKNKEIIIPEPLLEALIRYRAFHKLPKYPSSKEKDLGLVIGQSKNVLQDYSIYLLIKNLLNEYSNHIYKVNKKLSALFTNTKLSIIHRCYLKEKKKLQ